MSRFIRIDDIASDERTPFFADLIPEAFDGEQRLRMIGAVDERGIPEGAVTFAMDENIVNIMHVEVYEELRRQGIATALIRTLLSYLSLSQLPFVAQAVYSVDPDGEDGFVDAFFRSLPEFEVVSGGRYCKITPDTALDSAGVKALSSFSCDVIPYTQLSEDERLCLRRDLDEKKLGDFLSLPLGDIIPELSLCHMEKGKCKTCVIFTQTGMPDTVELSFIMSLSDNKANLAGVLNEVISRYRKHYAKKNMVFSLVTEESESLARKIFVDGIKESEILTAVSFG